MTYGFEWRQAQFGVARSFGSLKTNSQMWVQGTIIPSASPVQAVFKKVEKVGTRSCMYNDDGEGCGARTYDPIQAYQEGPHW